MPIILLPFKWQCCKEFACNAGDLGLIPGSGRFPEKGWQPTPVFLPGEFHGQRSQAGCSSWGHKRVGHGWAANTHSTNQSTLLNASLECFVFFGEGDLSNRSGRDSWPCFTQESGEELGLRLHISSRFKAWSHIKGIWARTSLWHEQASVHLNCSTGLRCVVHAVSRPRLSTWRYFLG